MVVKMPAAMSTSHMEMWMPGPSRSVEWSRPVEGEVVELQGSEPASGVRARGVERHVAEIEQAGVADDDVQAQRHHRDRGRRPLERISRDEVADQREVDEVRRGSGSDPGSRAPSRCDAAVMRARVDWGHRS